MKVLCIKEGNWVGVISNTISPGPKFGDVCAVTGISICDGYLLLEWPDEMSGYDKDKFIPISDIDEMEFVRNYKTENV